MAILEIVTVPQHQRQSRQSCQLMCLAPYSFGWENTLGVDRGPRFSSRSPRAPRALGTPTGQDGALPRVVWAVEHKAFSEVRMTVWKPLQLLTGHLVYLLLPFTFLVTVLQPCWGWHTTESKWLHRGSPHSRRQSGCPLFGIFRPVHPPGPKLNSKHNLNILTLVIPTGIIRNPLEFHKKSAQSVQPQAHCSVRTGPPRAESSAPVQL